MKKPPARRFSKPKTKHEDPIESWHNGGDVEVAMYARSLWRIAQRLIESLDPSPNPATAWDACPALLLYRQSLELHLKLLIGEGVHFLPSPPDFITLYKTHSIRWLAQIVSQIIRNGGWEKDFKCDGITTLMEFSTLVKEVESLDPVACAATVGKSRRDGSIPAGLEPPKIAHLARTLDGLLNLLDATTDGLAATRDQRSGEADFHAHGSFGPTIQ